MGNDSNGGSGEALIREIAQIDSGSEPAVHVEELAAGARLGRFVVQGELGRGGMGIVYRARDDTLARVVALKVLGKTREGSPERRARFLREARSAASIVHANVATVYEVGEAGASLYIAMELVSGKSLRNRFVAGEPLPSDEVVTLARGIGRGLDAAHAQGIVHRDLKPENVMVDVAGQPKILDFGLAKLRAVEEAPREILEHQPTDSPSTEYGRILGTPAYMSPEQAAGKLLDARSDLFSLGVVLYEALTGMRPFVGETPHELLAAVMRDTPRAVGDVNAAAPRELAGLVMRCLAKAPADRPAMASDFLRELDELSAAARISVGGTDVRSAAPRPKRAMFALMALVVGAGAFAWSASTARDAASRPDPMPVASAAEAAPPRGIAMTAYPPPKTNVPAAAAAYAAGLSSMRDGAFVLGAHAFQRAAKLDPTMAAAHLRVSLYGGSESGILPTQLREAAATAARFRASLDDRDLALLRVAEALAVDPPDYSQVVERTRAVAARFPSDAEIQWLLAAVLPSVDKLEEAHATARHALDLDPEFAAVLANQAWWAYEFRHDEAALKLYDRCLALSPGAGSCLRGRADLHEARGECAAVEADARHLTQIEPTSPSSYELLARALAGRGAPIESVRLALDRMVDLGADVSLVYTRTVANYWLALLSGDLEQAEVALREADRSMASETSASAHEQVTESLTRLAIERGESPGSAARFYAGAEKITAARSPDAPGGLSTIRLYELHRAKRLGDTEFQKERDRRYRESFALSGAPAGSFDADRQWITIYVEPATTLAEITDTLALLKARGPTLDEWGLTGRIFLAAGRFDEALATLRPAAARCDVIPQTQWAFAPTTWWWLDEHRQLGEALEAKGNTAEACATYAVILDRWKNARPRSVTLEKAKQRTRALNCPR